MAPDDDPEFLRGLEQDIRRRKHHPGTSASTPNHDEGGTGEDAEGPDAGEAGDTDRSGSDQH